MIRAVLIIGLGLCAGLVTWLLGVHLGLSAVVP